MNKEVQDELFAYLRLVDDESKPMTGTNPDGRDQYQYTRLAVVQLPAGSYKLKKVSSTRHFVVFAESTFLFNAIHDKLKTEDWIREGFEDKFIYIEEVLHRPRPGEQLNEYTSYIPQNENDLWIAIFNFLVKQGILEKSARKVASKEYRLPTADDKKK